jgi:hypothetical protein
MSLQSKRELLAQTALRYRHATHAQKTQILDEFVAATGYARKYAIRLLTQPQLPLAVPTRSRTPRYGPAVQEALIIAWLAANAICAKRLVPFLPILIPQLERLFGASSSPRRTIRHALFAPPSIFTRLSPLFRLSKHSRCRFGLA